MNSKILPIIIVIALIVVGFFLFRGSSQAPTDLMNPASGTSLEGSDDAGRMDTPFDSADRVMPYTLEARPFEFSIKEMRVKEGDTVRVTLNNVQGMHDWKIDEFSAATRVLRAGESETIEFVADKAGTYEYYCSVGDHRAMGMVGTLIVEPAE